MSGQVALDLGSAMYLFGVHHALLTGHTAEEIAGSLRQLADDVAVALVVPT